MLEGIIFYLTKRVASITRRHNGIYEKHLLYDLTFISEVLKLLEMTEDAMRMA